VPIAGYDPRDLLSGHYLRFQYVWNLAPGSAARGCRGEDCALCTDDPAPFNPQVSLVPLADAPAQCTSFIAGSTVDRFDPGDSFFIRGTSDNLTRYYIPENEAMRLQRLLLTNETNAPQFSLGLRVTAAGTAYIEAMYVDGVPLEQWLRTY
jgi:hypothetical protein